jgi:1,4-alpha-glucan branching enzyme
MPFVRHPEDDDFLEEGWLCEAILETYIPLLWMLERLADENVPYRLTLSTSPTLDAMLGDSLLRARFARRLADLTELAEREVLRTRHHPEFHETALFHRDRFRRAFSDYEHHWQRDLTAALRRLGEAGHLELITSAATHGYLPLLAENELAVRAQIRVAVAEHQAVFGAPPAGLWLPECGYYPELDALLADAGLRYSFLETHAIDHSTGRALDGVYTPLRCPSGLFVFGRDPESTRQVWSSSEGYPGDPEYREYYRDVGFDRELRELGPLAHPLGIRRNVGIKYHRVTGRTEQKEPYVRARALARVAEHARDFCENRRQKVSFLASRAAHDPIVVAPYDAELFGHWWFEGPEFLGCVLEELATDPDVGLLTPSEYLAREPLTPTAAPSASSWGYKGYSEMWLNGKNHWIYPHLHEAADRMIALAAEHPAARGNERRVLAQAARELLLAQASDWAFIMTQGTFVDYATRRTKEHLSRFHRLSRMLKSGALDLEDLASIEAQDNLFPNLDYRVYRSDYALRASASSGNA